MIRLADPLTIRFFLHNRGHETRYFDQQIGAKGERVCVRPWRIIHRGNLLRRSRKLPFPWGNEDTQTLIDIFDRYQIRATFFVVGEWVEKYPESVKALHEAGHEVMNHSNDHAHFNSLSSEEIISNIQACNEKLQAITGVAPTLFRPPYGEYDDHVVLSVRSMGMEPIQWDVEPLETSATPLLPGVSLGAVPKERPYSPVSPFYFFAPRLVDLHKIL